uniref:HMG box domain-containing protein n=1 Tax=Strongyloides stercoralis TaxID=6248 RepID=A0A0K0E8J5_STRER
MAGLVLLKRSFFTTVTCFKSEVSLKNIRAPGYGHLSGYSVYISEHINQVEGVSTVKIKELAKKWHSESDAVKESFSKKASLLNKEKQEKFNSLPQEEQDRLIDEGQRKLEKRKHRKEKAVRKERQNEIVKAIGMERPPGAFFQFVKEYYQMNPNSRVEPNVSEKISSLWKNLPEKEKEERIRKNKEELALWNKKKDEYMKKLESE